MLGFFYNFTMVAINEKLGVVWCIIKNRETIVLKMCSIMIYVNEPMLLISLFYKAPYNKIMIE